MLAVPVFTALAKSEFITLPKAQWNNHYLNRFDWVTSTNEHDHPLDGEHDHDLDGGEGNWCRGQHGMSSVM